MTEQEFIFKARFGTWEKPKFSTLEEAINADNPQKAPQETSSLADKEQYMRQNQHNC